MKVERKRIKYCVEWGAVKKVEEVGGDGYIRNEESQVTIKCRFGITCLLRHHRRKLGFPERHRLVCVYVSMIPGLSQ